MNFDDNALFRHADLRELRDITEEDPLEVEASKYSLNYIKLDGNVGCMVNGAGLAMATMDIIKYAGGMPANFLDVGGGANAEQVAHAFEILLSDKNVKAVLINIFGGILRVDTLATGVVEAARKTKSSCRSCCGSKARTWSEGKKILQESGLNFIVARNHEGRGGESCGRGAGCGVTDGAKRSLQTVHEYVDRRNIRYASDGAGPDRSRRYVSRQGCAGVWHEDCGRSDSGQGRNHA